MNEIAVVDTSYLRESAREIGSLLKDAHNARMAEVSALLSIQGTVRMGLESANALEGSQGLGEGVDYSA